MRIARFLSALLLLATAAPARAAAGRSFLGDDDSALLTVHWEPAFPVGALKDLVEQVSLEGVSGDVRLALGNSNFSLGVGVSWNRFYGGTPYSVVSALSPMALFHGYLSRGTVQPYLGVGAGGVHADTSVNGAPYVKRWGFCADPQLGLLVTVTPELALDLRLHYEWTSLQTSGGPRYQWVGLGLGFAVY